MEILIDGLELGTLIIIAVLLIVINIRIFIKLFVYPDTKIFSFTIPKLFSKGNTEKEEDINA